MKTSHVSSARYRHGSRNIDRSSQNILSHQNTCKNLRDSSCWSAMGTSSVERRGVAQAVEVLEMVEVVEAVGSCSIHHRWIRSQESE